jgi:outer membrane autotransporter protein
MKRNLRKTRRRLKQEEQQQQTGYNELSSSLTVDASEKVEEPAPSFKKICSPWVELFGEYAHQKGEKNSPSFNDSLGGVVLALDLYNYKTTLFGAGVGYTYSYVHEGGGSGHAVINQEYAVFYGTFEFRKFYADPAVWGGLIQIENSRHIHTATFTADARSNPNGWMVSPHLEVGYDIDRNWLTVEPFAMFDWPNIWENSFHEHGAGSFDVTQPRHHSSMLRSEVGFRFYQAIRTHHARCILQEKASYVNKKPFEMGAVTAFISGIPGSLTVDTLSGMQNLGCGEIEFLYDPDNKAHPYISISYQGETSFSASYFSHLAMISMGKEF